MRTLKHTADQSFSFDSHQAGRQLGQELAARYWLPLLAIMASIALWSCSTAHAAIVLGNTNAALLDSDLTDPENDGAPDANTNYNAIFSSSIEPGFGGGEFAFNVFDNLTVGGGNNKWCCNAPTQWVQAEFPVGYRLTHFTITSGNDSEGREPDSWSIQGSNDGVIFTNIFSVTETDVFPGAGVFDQVVLFDAGNYAGMGFQGDFTLPPLYRFIRFEVTSIVSNGGDFQLDELEFFGFVPVPEPSTLSLAALGLIAGGYKIRRRRAAK